MYFDKESKSERFFFAGGGGGERVKRGGGEEVQPKKKVSRYSLYIIVYKFKFPSSSGSLVLKQTKGVMDGRQMDTQRGWPIPICPLNFFEVGDITMHKYISYGSDKLNL